MNEMSEEETLQAKQMQAESEVVADIVRRVLIDRPLPVCLNVLLSNLYGIGMTVSPEAQNWMANEINRVVNEINFESVKTASDSQQSH